MKRKNETHIEYNARRPHRTRSLYEKAQAANKMRDVRANHTPEQKQARAQYQKQWYKDHPTYTRDKYVSDPTFRQRSKEQSRNSFYNLKPGWFETQIIRQQNQCACCGCTPNRLVIEHHHATRTVRGLTCDRCNQIIGALEDPKLALCQLYLQERT